MTPAQVVETSVTVKNSPFQDFVHPNDQGWNYLAKIICCPQKGQKATQKMALPFVRTGNHGNGQNLSKKYINSYSEEMGSGKALTSS